MPHGDGHLGLQRPGGRSGGPDSVDTNAREVHVSRSRNELRNAPSFDAARGVDSSYRSDLDTYFAPSRGGSSSQRRQRREGQAPTRRRTSRRARREEPTKDELYQESKRLGIEGRSKMSKAELAHAVGRARGRGGGRPKAHPVDVRAFLEGVRYPTEKGDLLRQARREGASEKVRSTIQRLPDKKFKDPTAVSEAIGNPR